MRMQTSNGWSCLPCSFAMVLDIPVKKFIEMIGHDGSAKPYEGYSDQIAGFHEQECIEVLQQLGYACTPIEIIPQIMPVPGGPIRPVWFLPERLTGDPEDVTLLNWNWQRFICHLKGTRGVITGAKKRIDSDEMLGHAVAWDGLIHDPQGKGFTYTIEEAHNYGFIPRGYWKIQEIINGRSTKNGSFNTCAEETEKI